MAGGSMGRADNMVVVVVGTCQDEWECHQARLMVAASRAEDVQQR